MSFRVQYRKEKLLKELIKHKGFISSFDLSSQFGVSSRTIRNDIKQLSSKLEEMGVELEAVPSKGFRLKDEDREKARNFLMSEKHLMTDIPSLPNDRVKFIIHKLLFSQKNLTIGDLSKYLCISPSTVEKDLQEVRQWLSFHNLGLANRKEGGICLVGSEIMTRYAMVNFFSGLDASPALPDVKDLKEVIGCYYVGPIIDILNNIFDTQGIFLSDAEFLNLTTYLSVSLLRISEQHEINQVDYTSADVENSQEFILAQEIAARITQAFSINLPRAESLHLTRYLMQINILAGDVQEDSFQPEGNSPELINEIITELNSKFHLDFSRDLKLNSSLKLYINSLLNRKKYKTLVKNPGLGEIAAQYPDALEMAVSISQKLKDGYDLSLNEHEIGYLTLYICAALERQKAQNGKTTKKVVIICATGSGGSQLLAVKIRRNFQELDIIGIYPAYRLAEALKQEPDFIISTNPIQDAGCPVVHISHLLNEDDLVNIQRTLDDDDHQKNLELSSLFHSNLFFPDIVLNERTDVINFLCEGIKAQGYADDTFAPSVLEREAIFSTAIGNLVAIPHAFSGAISESWIAIGLLKRPILWGNDLAQLILLLNINNAEQENFKTIYEMLYEMVNDKQNIQKLLKVTNFIEFLKAINE